MADEQDRLLPIANVARIMKKIIPPSAKISKEAKQRIQECASEFISFVTCEASHRCHKENRRTLNGDDICWALSSLGLDNHADATTRYLHKYTEFQRLRDLHNKASSCSINEENGEPINFEEAQPTYKASSIDNNNITVMDRYD